MMDFCHADLLRTKLSHCLLYIIFKSFCRDGLKLFTCIFYLSLQHKWLIIIIIIIISIDIPNFNVHQLCFIKVLFGREFKMRWLVYKLRCSPECTYVLACILVTTWLKNSCNACTRVFYFHQLSSHRALPKRENRERKTELKNGLATAFFM